MKSGLIDIYRRMLVYGACSIHSYKSGIRPVHYTVYFDSSLAGAVFLYEEKPWGF